MAEVTYQDVIEYLLDVDDDKSFYGGPPSETCMVARYGQDVLGMEHGAYDGSYVLNYDVERNISYSEHPHVPVSDEVWKMVCNVENNLDVFMGHKEVFGSAIKAAILQYERDNA